MSGALPVHSADEDAVRLLLDDPDIHGAPELFNPGSPLPHAGGVYAIYVDVVPPGVTTQDCHVVDGRTLLYVGISPKAPADGHRRSRQTLYERIRYHYRGNAEASTLRLTLGSLLADELGLVLRRVGSGKRMTFCHEGEQAITEWMARHVGVAWAVAPGPWTLEEWLIKRLVLPLNLDQNYHSPFRATLSALRRAQRERARHLPVVPG